jgi:small subunit ribosomal protein S7
MSRPGVKNKRSPTPDPKYGNILLHRFINKLIKCGKKRTAFNIVYGALEDIRKKTNEDPLKVFLQCIENVRPLVELKPRRIGGATYQIPVEVPFARSETMAMRWILMYAKQRKGKPMKDRLTDELMAAYKKENSAAIKKREDTHKMAEANRAFAHYRW